MEKRIWTAVVGLAALAALISVPTAMAAYTSPKLEVVWTSPSTAAIRASVDPNDDATASIRILAPAGTQLTTTQAPGTTLGSVEALVKALDLGGADIPVQGQVVAAGPGQVPASVQAACTQGVTPLATWLLALSAAGQALNVPAFLVPTTGAEAALGPAYIQVCLGPPDVPPGTPGRATFGIKVYSVGAELNGVFSSGAGAGAWISFWTPYTPGAGTVNAAGTVAAPAVLAPGTVTLTARRAGRGATLTGRVTQGGAGRNATVAIAGGAASRKLKALGRARVAANGAFTFRAKSGAFFRATAVATAGASSAACARVGPRLAPVPCVNGTVSGFRAQSKVVKKR